MPKRGTLSTAKAKKLLNYKSKWVYRKDIKSISIGIKIYLTENSMIIKLIKKLVLPVLYSIRKILNILKKHMMPDIVIRPKKSYFTAFDMFTEEEEIKSYNHFKKFFKTAIFLDESQIKEYSINRALELNSNDQFFLEFGVFQGKSINFFAKKIKNKTIYGFDSFSGLNEDWEGTQYQKGYFDLKGKTPKVEKNVILIKGKVQETLVNFLDEHNPRISFVHIDLDTYDSTKFVLSKIKKNLSKNAIILFDELYNFSGWDVGEYKALQEIFDENDYKFLAFSKDGCQAVIETK